VARKGHRANRELYTGAHDKKSLDGKNFSRRLHADFAAVVVAWCCLGIMTFFGLRAVTSSAKG